MQDLKSWIQLTDEPEVRARRRYLAKEFIEADPELKAEFTAYGERKALRVVLAERGLTPSAQEHARIDACSDLSTLERWIAQALTAATVAEALR